MNSGRPTHGLNGRELARQAGFAIHDVRCRVPPRPAWAAPEVSVAHAMVFVRAGSFRRMADGVDTVVDPGVVYLRRPGEEQRIAHPTGGDVCTSVHLDPSAVASIWGGDPSGLPAVVFTSSAVDLDHRRLLRTCLHGDGFEVEERLHLLVARVLTEHEPARVASGRPTTALLRRRLVADTRERLATAPWRTLTDLARELSTSPHHLSRIFSAATGTSLTTYRNRVRVRLVLERLAAGETSLARLAADLGFADHAHLVRTVRRHTGSTPSDLRRVLATAGPADPPGG